MTANSRRAEYSAPQSKPTTKKDGYFAILMVAQREDVKNCTEERIFICSDSQAALRAISSPRTRSKLVQECGDALESLARQKEVGLVWVPEHMGIPGNERADQLARLGSGKPPQGPEPILGISRGSINGALSRWAYRRLGMSWRMNTGCRQAHNFLDGPDMSKTVWLLNLGRRALNQMVECGEGEDAPIHLLGHCITFGRLRHKVFGTGELQGEEMGSLPWTKILTFIRASGRLEEGNRRNVDR
ncbi:hypothetical protein NQ315_016774 [Exocentrus adspersus]|uniref:RNase H type-1 domain-containing protein n=1 Tax=Exocentrus adspersus TaxID=1586481 RepID=A0AAV8VDZ0_9CUCU|nr:hypothetical protein NQ315_016774 [Exocentrus adspersus]